MGKVVERFAGRFVVLATVAAILAGPSPLPGEEPTGGSPFFEEPPPLLSAPELAPDAVPAPDWTEPDEAYPLAPSPPDAQAEPIPGADAPIYPVLREHCRYSRIYRSEILGRLWFRGEVLGWWTKGVKLPPLVTTGPLDDETTLILFGDSVIHHGMNPGGRLTLGWWWDPRQLGGVEASYLGLASKELRHYSEALLGEATIARPFRDVTSNNEWIAHIVAGLVDGDGDVWGGSIDVRADMELQGAEVLLRRVAVCRPGFRMDMLSGYRYGRLIDRLTIGEYSVSPLPPYPSGEDITITEKSRFDLFKSTNDFHGGEAGLAATWTRGRWSVEFLGKAALGGTSTAATIQGGTEVTTTEITYEADGPSIDTTGETYRGGLLALPKKNIGRHVDGELSLLSELGLSLRYQLACDLWLSAGYNLLLWTRVGRAGDQIDLYIDRTEIPEPSLVDNPQSGSASTTPPFALSRSDFWAQGLNLRLEHQF